MKVFCGQNDKTFPLILGETLLLEMNPRKGSTVFVLSKTVCIHTHDFMKVLYRH